MKKSVTNFIAIIKYQDTKTQIPNHYHYEVKINDNNRIFDFDNNN